MPLRSMALLLTTMACVVVACSSSNSTPAPATQTGQACTAVNQCYPGIDAGALQGETCLTQLQGGYCTHTCSTDADCCAVPGECPEHFKEVCASFESSGQNYCFLSCDTADLATDDGGTTDPNTFCQRWANTTFTCRSTGGGSQNRKFCGP